MSRDEVQLGRGLTVVAVLDRLFRQVETLAAEGAGGHRGAVIHLHALEVLLLRARQLGLQGHRLAKQRRSTVVVPLAKFLDGLGQRGARFGRLTWRGAAGPSTGSGIWARAVAAAAPTSTPATRRTHIFGFALLTPGLLYQSPSPGLARQRSGWEAQGTLLAATRHRSPHPVGLPGRRRPLACCRRHVP